MIRTTTARRLSKLAFQTGKCAAASMPVATPCRRMSSLMLPTCRNATILANKNKQLGRRYNSSTALDIGAFHQISDDALEHILEEYEVLAESVPEIDVELAQGVLTLVMPPLGTYVINKQPPNKQIWLSSPVSGPKRYDWVDGKWVYARDNSTLGNLLREETLKVTEGRCGAIELPEVE